MLDESEELDRSFPACDDCHLWLEQALRHSDAEYWEFNLKSRALKVFYLKGRAGMACVELTDAPSSILDSGAVHPSSMQDVIEFFDKMLDGCGHDSTTAQIMRRGSEEFCWCSISYRVLAGDESHGPRAVGMISPLSFDSDQGVLAVAKFPEVLYPNLLRFCRGCITSGRANVFLRQDEPEVRLLRELPFERAVSMGMETLFSPGDMRAYRELLDPENLSDRFREHRRWSLGRFKMVVSGSEVCTARVAANVRSADPDGALMVSVYVNLCDTRNAWESHAEISVERDPDTQLYSQKYARLLVDSLLSESDDCGFSAVSVIDISGAENLDIKMRHDLMTAIGIFLNTDCVAFKDGSSVCAFIPNVSTPERMRDRLEKVLQASRASLTDGVLSDATAMDKVRLVAVAVFGGKVGFDFDKAVARVREVLDRSRHTGIPGKGDSVIGPVKLEEAGAIRLDADGAHEGSLATSALTSEELAAYVETLQTMLDAKTPVQAISCALSSIGRYYAAKRAYVLSVPRKNGLLGVLFEWTEPGATSIRRLFARMPVSRFPFIKVNATRSEPVYVEREHHDTSNDGQGEPTTWRYALIPVMHADDIDMVLCIDQLEDNRDSLGLASALSKCIKRCWKRIDRRLPRSGDGDELKYESTLHDEDGLELDLSRANEGSWNSLGVLVVKLDDPVGCIRELGIRGTFDLCYGIRRMAVRLFDGNHIYHAADDEYVVLAPCCSYRSFIRSCAQARMELMSQYPTRLLLGSSWTDNLSDAHRILQEARIIAEHDKAFRGLRMRGGDSLQMDHARSARFSASVSKSLEERFTIYLQPQIDIRTGILVGAEALARRVVDDGSAVSPAGDIAKMEKDGKISELDYFVFGSVLSVMESWLERGAKLFPVACNFSRTTLIAPTALASILAIMSRYSDVPAENVEMEVTESAIDMGTPLLRELVERYRSYGLRVALDDFGAHYSNASVLANVKFDTIKLDRSIISDLPVNDVSQLLVKNIVEICKSRDMECVAEGIETVDQARALVEEGCNVCQGFYYDRPMPVDLFERKYLSLN